MSNKRNFGSLRKLPSGMYQVRYSHPVTSERITAPITYKLKSDAYAWLASEQAAIAQGTYRDLRMTRGTLAEYGERCIMQRSLKANTREDYLSAWRIHVVPYLGQLPVSQLTGEHVRTWVHERKQATGAYAVKHAYAVLRMVMNTAVDDNITRSNPCTRSNSVRAVSPKREPLTPEQVATLAGAVPEHYSALVLLLGWVGLRIGEATGLTVSDLDLTDPHNARIRIERRVYRLKTGELNTDTPKSLAGHRTVVIPPTLVPVLIQHLERYNITDPDAWVFPTKQGQCAVTAAPKEITKVLRSQGYANLRTHDLRATAATAMTNSGASLVQVMHRLGHSTVNAAMIYQRATSDADRDVALTMASAIILPDNVIPLQRKAG